MYNRIGILQTAVFLEIYSLDESESTASNSRVSLMSLFYLGILESCSKLITQLNERNCQRKTFLVLLQDFVTKLLTHDNILWVSLRLAFLFIMKKSANFSNTPCKSDFFHWVIYAFSYRVTSIRNQNFRLQFCPWSSWHSWRCLCTRLAAWPGRKQCPNLQLR